MGDECREGRVEHGFAGLPAQDDRFLVIIQTLLGNPLKVDKGVLMAPDQREKVVSRGEINEMPSGIRQDLGETLHLRHAGPDERDLVRAPIHLALTPG
jgi:hypothetical protein